MILNTESKWRVIKTYGPEEISFTIAYVDHKDAEIAAGVSR